MAQIPASNPSAGGYRYRRHRPEETLLYRVVEQHYPEFAELMRGQGRPLPTFVYREFVEYLKCGRLEYGFLRVRYNDCHAEKLVAFSCKGRGFCPSCGARRTWLLAPGRQPQTPRAPPATLVPTLLIPLTDAGTDSLETPALLRLACIRVANANVDALPGFNLLTV